MREYIEKNIYRQGYTNEGIYKKNTQKGIYMEDDTIGENAHKNRRKNASDGA